MVRDAGLAILVPFARSRGELISCISARLVGRVARELSASSRAGYLISSVNLPRFADLHSTIANTP
jgi:hypothetical protein